MNTWKKVNIDFPTIKLGDFIEPIKTTVADLGLDNPVVYGVTNIEGITQTGKPASKDLGKYIALEKDCFAYNPYRINVGSIGINELNLQGCVSPAYVVFKTKNGLLPKFLFHYIKSEFGIHLINWYGNKGGVRNALRFDDLCKIDIPDITKLNQEEILTQLDEYKDKIHVILEEIESQKLYAKQLRQNILQDAIEGKLTAEWRKTHPVIKGNPDFDAEALFEQIQKEKKTCKVEKLQEPLFFEALDLPDNWKYPTLFEITKQITDGTHLTPNYVENGEVFLSAQNVKPFRFIPEVHKFVSKNDFDTYRNNRIPEINDILMARVGAGIGEAAVIDQPLNFAFYVSLCLIKTFNGLINPNYIVCVLNSSYGTNYSKNNISSTGASAGNYNLGHIRALKIPLPPLKEQEEIIIVLKQLLEKVEQIEQQISQREEYANQLMRSILKDAFEEK